MPPGTRSPRRLRLPRRPLEPPEVQAELRRMMLLNRSTFPVGTAGLAIVMTLLAWGHVPQDRLVAWCAAGIACALLFVVALYPPLVRRTARDGLPLLGGPAGVISGIVFGLLPWLEDERLITSPMRWVALVGLFAMAAGISTGGLSGTSHPQRLGMPMWAVAIPAYARAGDWVIVGGLLLFVAITARDARTTRRLVVAGVEARMAAVHAAVHDDLTGLANRAGALAAIERLRDAAAGDAAAEITVMYVDLDRFKQVNDRFGHGVGDGLLVAAAARLTACFRGGDVVARVGGDEFVVVMPLDPDAPIDSQRLSRRVIAELERPFDVDGRELLVSASVGVATARAADADAAELIGRADQALFHAKREGRRRAVHFHDALRTWLDSRTTMEMALRRALPDGAIVPFGQPVFRLGDGGVDGVELLARWLPASGAPVPADVFVSLAEELGLVRDLGRQMLAHAGRAIAAWEGVDALADAVVGVNISPLHVVDGLLEDVEEALAAGIPAHRLLLEITEAAAPPDETALLDVLHAVAALGVRVAVDDFGAGFSSIRALDSLPATVVKLDRSLLGPGDPERRADVLRSVALLARALDRTLVAEGIESPRELAAVRAAGIDLGQGFGLCRPLRLDELPGALPAACDRLRAATADDAPASAG